MDLNRHSFEDEGLNLLPQGPELDVWEMPFSWEKVLTSLRMAAPSEVRPLRHSAAAHLPVQVVATIGIGSPSALAAATAVASVATATASSAEPERFVARLLARRGRGLCARCEDACPIPALAAPGGSHFWQHRPVAFCGAERDCPLS